MTDKTETDFIVTPEGRLINHAIFERDIFTDSNGKEGKPKYNVELAFAPADVTGEAAEGNDPTLEDHLFNYAEEKWGEGAGQDFLDGNIRNPLLDGDKLKKKREKNGKVGDAYEGLIVIRANTLFNRHGEEGPGGIQVWDENVESVDPVNREKVYNGSMGVARLSIDDYEDDHYETGNALMFYLSAYQFTGDGERLVASADTSTAFKAVGREKGKSKRKTRRG